MLKDLNKKLDLFTDKLAGLNYVCSCELHEGKWLKGENEVKLIKLVLGSDVKPVDITVSSMNNLLADVESGFLYPGGDSHYPNRRLFKSDEFNKKLNMLICEMSTLLIGASKIYKFQIKKGHPFYPVFWGYTYLVKCNNKFYILIGSSSD